MFMRENRRKNGAVQPEQMAASQRSNQASARKLAPNNYPNGPSDDWRFQPSLETCASINEDHYQGGVGGSGPYGKTYEDKVPFVGQKAPAGESTELKKR